ncbi:sulfite exporter TauE/SafE family protein [Bordetella genomosp. 9]|uniref:sulfite exporter TauE/SafE family protein n=1 Tax=Bordetella genomosp. 9 TaxID=1416803 RepID=UPI001E61986E|nr:sulfite exporter TauE/SafE family protein [Bordetella genomosp. 9]
MTMWELLAAHVGPAATGLDLFHLLIAGAAITGGYTVFGMTGFGSAIVSMPLLTQIMPLHQAVPVALICDMVSGMLLGATSRSAVYLPELRRIVPWMLAGMGLGLALLMYVPERPLLIVLGCGVLGYSLWRLCGGDTFRRLSPRWAIPLGLGGGGFTAMFGTGGPLYTIYLAGRLEDRNALRATVGTLIMLTGFTRLLMFTVTGLLLQPAVLALAVWLLPCSLAGVRLGSWLRHYIPAPIIARLVWTILILGSVSLLIRAIGG